MIISGKNMLITGASQGLGSVMATEFASLGAHVILNCAHHASRAECLAETIRKSGGKASVKVFDISDESAVRNSFAELDRDFGGVDILVNNARLDPYRRDPADSDAVWFDQIVSVNLRGPYLCSFAAAEQMKRKHAGKIVHLSSVWAYRAASRPMMEYAMTKAALQSLNRSMSAVFAEYGVQVNAVAPGMILSREMHERLTEERLKEIVDSIPVRRGAEPAEIADAVRFVIENDYLNGETVNINGGVYTP